MKFSYFLFFILLMGCSPKKADKDSEYTSPKSPLFTLINPTHSGINFNNQVEENYTNFFAIFQNVYNGGGVAIGDINNDGLSDIYFTGNEVKNKLYLNKGDFRFEDITESAGVADDNGWCNGVVMADVNGDGLLDIYISKGGPKSDTQNRENSLFINNGDLTFNERSKEFGLNDNGYSMMASFFDMDNDNDLDMYLINRPDEFFLDYKKVLKGKKEENDLYRDKLFLNDKGKFKEIGLKAGIKNNFSFGLGVSTTDINNDGLIDIYVSNDYLENDYLYINQGNHTFKESIKEYTNHTSFYAMGLDVVDINNDGLEDIIELDMTSEDYYRSKTTMASMNIPLFKNLQESGFHTQYMHNTLQLNQGNGFFSEIGQLAGIDKTDWSWACLGSDFDNDGYRDLFVTNGYRRDVWDKDVKSFFNRYMKSKTVRKRSNEENAAYIINLYKPNKIPNYIYKNNGDLTFSKKTKDWGLNKKSFSNGAAVGDLDNDGDLDLVVNNLEGKAFLYKNRADKLKNNYIKIKLKGPTKNVLGLGSKIKIYYGKEIQYHEFKTVRGYLSSVEPTIHFGLGKNKKIDSLQVEWKDGKFTRIKSLKVNQTITLNYNSAKQNNSSKKQDKSPLLFVDKTDEKIKDPFKHVENEYDDYKDQILLPHKLSQNGPCISVGDINGDDLEDFFIGGAMGQAGATYTQNINGEFIKLKQPQIHKDKKHEDVGAVFFDADGDNDLDLYVVSGGNELTDIPNYFQDRLYYNNGQGKFLKSSGIPLIQSSGSCAVPIDFDSDGDLDLFVAGRVLPNKYPAAPNSYFLENNKGEFLDVTKTIAPEIANIGMVSSATAADVDNDGVKELIIVGEWMPLTIFKKENNSWKNVTSKYNLSKTAGWWNKIIPFDYDGDGDMDFVAGNLGLNYKFKASEKKPFFVYANDFDDNGTNDIFLAKYNNDTIVPVRGIDCSSQQIPGLTQKFRTYDQFAKSNLQNILGEEKTNEALKYEAHLFSSVILKNDGGKFSIIPLPKEAQFSVANGIVANDFNKDGILDLLIAGNKFDAEVETTRADASPGVFMIGKKDGTFKTTKPFESGFFVPYNVKDIQLIKNKKTGETGVIIAINNEEVKYFKINK
ncbi:VCBS repeat-containing protein [uncultured Maribacter sp.]|uniref:VCBS repeat-containing protein n=1 Tax=uncultured Maribacter sp. TaxID=431308 RepID=UPI00262967F1|nr:VCBS repeat-containing protein [uncultured Maribacter sp.]